VTEQICSAVGQGIVETAKNVMLARSIKPDLVIFDDSESANAGDTLRKMGHFVIGANPWMDRLANDTDFMLSMAESCGVRLPRTYYAIAKEQAIALVRRDIRKWFVSAKDLFPLCSDDPDQIENYMTRSKSATFKVSEFIFGPSLTTETWFRNGENVCSFGALENWHMHDGELGPSPEPQSTIVWSYHASEPRIYQSVAKKFAPFIQRAEFTGAITYRCIVSENDRKPYLVSLTSNPTRQICSARAELMQRDMCEHLLESGEKPDCKRGFAYSCAVSIPPYPTPLLHRTTASLSAGVHVGACPSMSLFDVRNDGKHLVSAGTCGLIGDIMSYGTTIDEARTTAVRHVDKLVLHGKQARRGGGTSRFARDIERLDHFGYEVPRQGKEDVCESPTRS
jgi:hypothetical protein